MTREHGDGLFGLDGFAEPEKALPAARVPWARWRLAVAGVGVTAVLVAGVVVAAAAAAPAPNVPAATATSTAGTSSSPSSTTAPVPAALPANGTTPPTPTVLLAPPAGERADLEATAAHLTMPVRLGSPSSWDQWLPKGKPYPGSSTEDEMSTCPRMSDRLTQALGVQFSYWIGTLPGHGCTWVPVPLDYDGPYHYAYTLTIGFIGDGTTIGGWRQGNSEHGGTTACPDVDVPTVAPGAALMRCEDPEGPDYALAVPDTRTHGFWVVEAFLRSNAQHPGWVALQSLLAGATAAFG